MNDGSDADTHSGDETSHPSGGTAWPAPLSGVTESIVTTLGPNDRWNVAALGLFTDDTDADDSVDNADSNAASDKRPPETSPVTARTWGNTRTRRNFHRQGEAYIQFVTDPVVFADAALTISELDSPVLDAANAWARVSVTPIDSGTDDGTTWEQWELEPIETGTERETVPTINRGFNAVIEATVAASRLGVSGYDDATLRNRLEFFASVVDRAGGPRERLAIERVRDHAEW
ncbi:DUF447 domain-containing protein [Natrialba asiatica]|uniref:DUF447 family protein n=1 Tax=Natrialba asiatica (strain ATCC 700177 / DSM 12278 / JCM 9576 / FERM P-10747 / NBRC 102637 / 172P1) TaxID=29540 RepID=M0AV76_NATA1|nr:DUF447 domain-containing protein [Natrialba asiatica]ELZ01863.1 hypothetical protein C481_10092 [Natrialba asiatica DSM 12278]